MSVEIIMPELGESVHEGTVTVWLKKVGDTIKEDEPIVEIMTDKVNTELPSPASGILKEIIIQEGEQVEVFSVMGIIDDGSVTTESSPSSVQKDQDQTSETPSTPTSNPEKNISSSDHKKWYTPVVKSIAKEHGLTDGDLETILGTGNDGRVTKKDVENYISSRNSTSTQKSHHTPNEPSKTSVIKDIPKTTANENQEIVPLAGMRKMIADAMVKSSQVPTVSTLLEVDVTALSEFRARNKESFQQMYGAKLTYTPFFIKAITEALVTYPIVNAALMPDNNIIMNKCVNLGVAVALGQKGEGGLIVPVIKNCQSMSLPEIAKALDDIAKKARSNQLGVQDVQGGTFTLTNPGSYGATFGTPMINAPQAGILGTYAIKKTPVVINDMIAIRSIMNLVLTYDHRLIDGAMAGNFLLKIKEKLEKVEFLA